MLDDPQVVKFAGPLLVGYLLTWGLFGVLCVQIYIYYLAFPGDKLLTKSMVYGILLIEIVQTVLVTHDAFEAFAKGFGDVDSLKSVHFTWLTMPVISGTVASTVQLFYAYRIKIISESNVTPLVIVTLSISQFVGAVIKGVAAAQMKSFSKAQTSHMVKIGCGIWASFGSACDVVIAIFMIYYLPRAKMGFHATQALVTRIILLTTGTGAMTAIVAILDLALFFGYHNGSYFLTPGVILGKLYSNSMMMVLNNRLRIVNGRYNHPTLSNTVMLGSSIGAGHGESSGSRSVDTMKEMEIQFTRTVDMSVE